jgi:hypothetical protein
MSFTENFERVGFSPIEEARFFYKALEIKEGYQLISLTHKNPKLQQLAKDIPASPITIQRRLYLLTLPEKVQDMIESEDLQLNVAEQISRLKKLSDETMRNKKMMAYAQNYLGKLPNIEELHDRINADLKFEKEQKEKDEEKLTEYEKAERKQRTELRQNLSKVTKWYNNTFDETIEITLESENGKEQIEVFIDALKEKATMTQDKKFNDLVAEGF